MRGEARVRPLAVLWAFVVRDLRIASTYRFQLFVQVAAMFSLAVTFFFVSLMLRGVDRKLPELAPYGGSYFAFVVLGLAVSLFMDAALRSFSLSVRTAQVTGTLEAMLATRTPVGLVVLGSALSSLVGTFARSAILVGLAVAVFGVPVAPGALALAALVVLLTGLATAALGIVAASFIVATKQGDPITTAISGLSWLFSGVLYPREILPPPVQSLAQALPMTHALDGLRRTLLLGAGWDDVSGSVLGLAGFVALAVPLGLAAFAFAVRRARAAGSLAQY